MPVAGPVRSCLALLQRQLLLHQPQPATAAHLLQLVSWAQGSVHLLDVSTQLGAPVLLPFVLPAPGQNPRAGPATAADAEGMVARGMQVAVVWK